MKPDPYTETVQALLALGGHRVWSLMVTLFGDMAQREGTAIDGPVLSAVMSAMDIRPEAVRVALHRLRKDGWIASEKQGRTRRHSLTAKSRAESIAASARIYAPPRAPGKRWQVAILSGSSRTAPEKMAKRGFAPLMPRVFIGARDAKPPKHALSLVGGEITPWLRQQIAPALHSDEYAVLLTLLQTLDRRLDGVSLSPLQSTVLRCLIVHNWRRIVLRHPPLPTDLLPENWPGMTCHALVEKLLARYPRQPLSAIAAV